MVAGIIIQILITIVIIVIAVFAAASLYMKGFVNGMRHEASAWVDAISKVEAPNWQSLPIRGEGLAHDLDPERLADANKVYVAAFKVALDVIKQEIATNRFMAVLKEFSEGTPSVGPS